MREHKIGDKFEIVKTRYYGEEWGVGSIVELVSIEGSSPNSLNFSSGEGAFRYCLSFGIDGEHNFPSLVRPLKTEAEKRGAKFGVGGVIKATGDKGVFWKSSSSYLGEEWYLFMNDGNILVIPSTQIRLDHEPEYKEIPFSEATHEQRMNVDNLVHVGGRKVEQIFRFNNDSYAFTYERDEVVYQSTSLVKVRVPT